MRVRARFQYGPTRSPLGQVGSRRATNMRPMSNATLALDGDPKWFLGFDCATATFAFSLSCIAWPTRGAVARALERVRAAGELLRRAAELADSAPIQAAAILAELAPVIANYDRETRAIVRIVDGETVSLCPGWADKQIPTVLRIQSMARYVARRVMPAIAVQIPPSETPQALIEFQKEANVPARKIMYGLIAVFAEHDPIIIGPSLKNKVATCEAGRYYNFAAQYAKAYDANKAHAKYNFNHLEQLFGSEIPQTSASLRGHIADSFMQVVGHLIHGGTAAEARARY